MKIKKARRYYFDTLILLICALYLVPWAHIDKNFYSTTSSEDSLNTGNVEQPVYDLSESVGESEALYSTLRDFGYQLDDIKNGFQTVPHVFLPKIPKDIKNFSPVHKRKQLFIMVTLPLILQTNQSILEDRQRLIALGRRIKRGTKISYSDDLWLQEIGEKYSAESKDVESLLERVDIVPVSLALAQAIEESGWGTSRFTHEGNALFGQRIYGSKSGMIPIRADSKTYKVKSYYELQGSVDSYIHNLNSHYAYEKFRSTRKDLRKESSKLDPILLAGKLDNYSEKGEFYTRKLIRIIRANDLTLLDPAKLAPDYFVDLQLR